MTSHWCDFQNTDVILHCGSNSVENHPVSSKWLNKAHERGAKWIVVDPRYTRTAEMADIYCPIRSGTDIAFYGGMYHYIIENLIEPNLADYLAGKEVPVYNFEYLLNYTNASYLLDPEYSFDVESGLFSGYDEATKTYSNHSWHYQTESEEQWDTAGDYAWAVAPGVPEFTTPTLQHPKRDMTLQDPMCVYQQFKKHYSRYDIETVCSVCGMDRQTLELVYETYTASAAPGKAGMILYALGQTQHTYGAQNTRAMSVMQLLLGNIGVPGGGVNALRGEPNVQGATDMGMMVNEHPAYLKWANTTDRSSLRKWLESQTYSDGYYTNKPKFIVSSLKEWFGENATVENDYGYDWWPKVPSKKTDQDYTHISTFELMSQGVIKGYFNWGMNPCHSAPNASNVRRAMANLDWLVVADQVATESATFWKAPDMSPEEINTTVYFLPCALIYEKPGVILNSGRWLQYRYQAVEPWDEAKPDYEMCDLLWTEICRLYEAEGGANPDPILKTKWDYYIDGKIDPRPVAWALNGYRVASSDFADEKVDLLSGYSEMAADGSTACAMWIYSGFWNNSDAPLDPAAQPIGRRDNDDKSGLGLYSNWAFSWPSNRRILYNRNSADMNGKPWAADKKLVEWTGAKWDLVDQADFVAAKNGTPVPPNNKTFFMLWEQNGRLESYGMEDGPVPEFYEPFESPVEKNLLNGALSSPCMRFAEYESTKHGDASDYPIVATTYSVTEHWQTGGQSRACPALVEAMPAQFVEISEELAAEKSIKPGDKVRVFNNRGSVVVDAVITKRLKPMRVHGVTQHLVGLTHHYSWAGVFGTEAATVNDLTPNVGDPNSFTPEYKAFLVDIERAIGGAK
nr:MULTISPECIES: molybdopterin-dependent oxidoreductase [unclassified Adlercreutzia]